MVMMAIAFAQLQAEASNTSTPDVVTDPNATTTTTTTTKKKDTPTKPPTTKAPTTKAPKTKAPTTTVKGNPTTFSSGLTFTVGSDKEAADFVKLSTAKDIMAHAIADATEKVTRSMVKVTSLKVGAAGRRLSVIARRLAATVVVKYTVTFPAGAKAPTLTSASMNTTKLGERIKTRAKTAGLTIAVSDVTAQPIVLTSAGGSTKAPSATTSTTGTETSPSVRHFLSIGIMMVSMMSLMHSR